MTHLPPFLLSNFLHALNNLLVDITIPGLRPASRRALGSLCRQRPCQNPTAERRLRNESDSRNITIFVHLALFLAVEHVVVVLHTDEFSLAVRLSAGLHYCKLVPPHRACADVPHLTHLYEVTQCLHGFFDQGIFVEAVALEQVHVVGVQAPEAGLDGLEDGLAREAAVVDIVFCLGHLVGWSACKGLVHVFRRREVLPLADFSPVARLRRRRSIWKGRSLCDGGCCTFPG